MHPFQGIDGQPVSVRDVPLVRSFGQRRFSRGGIRAALIFRTTLRAIERLSGFFNLTLAGRRNNQQHSTYQKENENQLLTNS